jgi:hypothetical protein
MKSSQPPTAKEICVALAKYGITMPKMVTAIADKVLQTSHSQNGNDNKRNNRRLSD